RNHADRADARRLVSERAPNLPRERRDRRFPAGAGDRSNRPWLVWKDLRRRKCQRAAWIWHAHERDGVGQSFGPLFGRDGHRTGISSLLCKTRAVGPGACNGDKQKARLYLAAVGAHAGNINYAQARFGFRQKIAQLHRVSFALTNSIWSAFGRSKRG